MINETRKRSFLKGFTQRVLEIGIATPLVWLVAGIEIERALGVTVMAEGICWAFHYVNERIWNRIQYGRYNG